MHATKAAGVIEGISFRFVHGLPVGTVASRIEFANLSRASRRLASSTLHVWPFRTFEASVLKAEFLDLLTTPFQSLLEVLAGVRFEIIFFEVLSVGGFLIVDLLAILIYLLDLVLDFFRREDGSPHAGGASARARGRICSGEAWFRSVQKNVESDSDQPFHDTRSATARLVTKAALLLLLLPRGLCPQTLLLLLLLLLGFRTRRVLRQR